MQVFYGILVQHFANVAASAPLHLDVVDVLTVHILALTAEVPYYAATVARARLTRAHKRVSAALAGLDGAASSAWPGQHTHPPPPPYDMCHALPCSLIHACTRSLPRSLACSLNHSELTEAAIVAGGFIC